MEAFFFASSERFTINEWESQGCRGRKCCWKGPQALTAVELVMVIIGTGNRGNPVRSAARALLRMAEDDLIRLSSFPPEGMTEIPGVGMAKALQITAALELGRRRQESNAILPVPCIVRSSADVYHRFSIRLADLGTRRVLGGVAS